MCGGCSQRYASAPKYSIEQPVQGSSVGVLKLGTPANPSPQSENAHPTAPLIPVDGTPGPSPTLENSNDDK